MESDLNYLNPKIEWWSGWFCPHTERNQPLAYLHSVEQLNDLQKCKDNSPMAVP